MMRIHFGSLKTDQELRVNLNHWKVRSIYSRFIFNESPTNLSKPSIILRLDIMKSEKEKENCPISRIMLVSEENEKKYINLSGLLTTYLLPERE